MLRERLTNLYIVIGRHLPLNLLVFAKPDGNLPGTQNGDLEALIFSFLIPVIRYISGLIARISELSFEDDSLRYFLPQLIGSLNFPKGTLEKYNSLFQSICAHISKPVYRVNTRGASFELTALSVA